MIDTPGPPPDGAELQIVGVDGSPGALHALRWAAARSELLGPVQPVMVWRHPWWASLPSDVGRTATLVEVDFVDAAETTARRQVEQLDGEAIRTPLAIHGGPGPTLVAVGRRSSLLVVGSRGQSGLVARVLGSTGRYCVQHASGPVAVVPETAPIHDHQARVVVGVDGSEASTRALDWVADNTEAATVIDVVHVCDRGGVTGGVGAMADQEADEQSRQILEAAACGIRTRCGPDRQINVHRRDGDPRQVLCDEARSADLLVVGGRGHGGLTHLVLGSTATALVEHSTAPTVVVR